MAFKNNVNVLSLSFSLTFVDLRKDQVIEKLTCRGIEIENTIARPAYQFNPINTPAARVHMMITCTFSPTRNTIIVTNVTSNTTKTTLTSTRTERLTPGSMAFSTTSARNPRLALRSVSIQEARLLLKY